MQIERSIMSGDTFEVKIPYINTNIASLINGDNLVELEICTINRKFTHMLIMRLYSSSCEFDELLHYTKTLLSTNIVTSEHVGAVHNMTTYDAYNCVYFAWYTYKNLKHQFV